MSELKVNVISEVTGANGVVVDSVKLKDGGIVIADAANIGSASDTDAIAIASDGVVTFSQATTFSGAITSSGIVTGTAFTAGSAVLAEAELELLDGLTAGTAIASKVVTTDANIDTTGQRNLTISGELDAATLDISGNADIDGTTNLDVVDIDGAVDMASTLQVDGVATFTARDIHSGGITIANAGQIGSVGDADAIAIASDGVVTFSQNPVATLATAAQGNITSLGTLTALTVDDVAIDGKVVTMTGSTDDTAVFTVATNGALTLETTDTAAAAANIQITADGTFEVDATTITLDSAGDIVLDAGGNDFNFKAGGTEVLRITNSSSDVIIKPIVDAKDLIFQQRDGTEVARIEDNATFNVVTGKLAINGTAITSTAAELNLLDGVSGLVQADLTKLAALDATAVELNYTDGVTSAIQTQMDTKTTTGKAVAFALVFG